MSKGQQSVDASGYLSCAIQILIALALAGTIVRRNRISPMVYVLDAGTNTWTKLSD